MMTQCPACFRSFELRRERLGLREEVLCPQCGALLSVVSNEPLRLAEVDLTDVPQET